METLPVWQPWQFWMPTRLSTSLTARSLPTRCSSLAMAPLNSVPPAVGRCRVRIALVHEVLVGNAIEEAAHVADGQRGHLRDEELPVLVAERMKHGRVVERAERRVLQQPWHDQQPRGLQGAEAARTRGEMRGAQHGREAVDAIEEKTLQTGPPLRGVIDARLIGPEPGHGTAALHARRRSNSAARRRT